MSENTSGDAYWKRNISLVIKLLIIWAIASYGFGILLRETLDSLVPFGGVGLGFWFAQQGSIYTFLILIFYYASAMNKLDKEFGVGED